MNKNIKLIIILVCVITLIAGGVFLLTMDRNTTQFPDPTKSGDIITEIDDIASQVVVEDTIVKNSTDNKFVNCLYPKITSLKKKDFENYINTQIATNIISYIEEIGYIVDDETLPTEMYRYVTTYDRYNCKQYLSLVINQDYQTGGIRSNKWKDIYNINVETERIFYLNELFEAGIDFESAIIAEISEQAKERNYEMMGGNGLSKLSTKQKFYIKDDKLVIYFDPSEAAATVFGELHFEMPFLMNDKGYFVIPKKENKPVVEETKIEENIINEVIPETIPSGELVSGDVMSGDTVSGEIVE